MASGTPAVGGCSCWQFSRPLHEPLRPRSAVLHTMMAMMHLPGLTRPGLPDRRRVLWDPSTRRAANIRSILSAAVRPDRSSHTRLYISGASFVIVEHFWFAVLLRDT